jgi:predicted nuclease of predicted toxin-antitoxin system
MGEVHYLVDENLSKSKRFVNEHPEFINVKDLINPGAEDDLIVERAVAGKFIIITKDIKLALYALIEGVRVWYFDVEHNEDHKLGAQHVQF